MADSSDFTPVAPRDDISIPIVTPTELGSSASGNDGMMNEMSGSSQNTAGGTGSRSNFVAGLLSRSALQSMLGSLSPSVNERMQAFRQTQQKVMQPWSEFFGSQNFRNAFGISHPQYILPRLRSNAARYQWNYIALCGATVALLALFSFTFFILGVALLALWGYVFFWRSEPFTFYGFTFSRTHVTIGLVILTALVSYLALGNKLFIIAICDAIFCLLHCLFRVSQEETIDFSRPA